METKIIEISKGQYLSEVYPIIETNKILCKCLPGLGATYSEIKANRNSIIIVPNLPAITCKCAVHKKDNLFGVKEGVKTDEIARYINESIIKNKNIKLISTPESFSKIKQAFEDCDLNIFVSCFILLDECHKLIKDRDYRENIVLPIDDFFQFDNKAMVSATPIIPSDPRFEEQNFSIVEIRPDYDYVQEVNIIHTNNMLECVKKILPYIEKCQETKRSICLFINSTDITLQLTEKLGLEGRSQVFCSEKSVEKLKAFKFKNAHSEWNKSLKADFMFFTSRFYNALDIELDEKPDVVFITEPYFAEYTIVDPMTDVPQAIGRFRNGVSSVTHILTTKDSIPVRTKEGINEFLGASEHAYGVVKTLFNSSKSKEERNAYNIAMESLPFNSMIKNGQKDWFAIDNYINDELVKSDYSDIELIKRRYNESQYFSIESCTPMQYKFGEYERLSLFNTLGWKKQLRMKIVEILDTIKNDVGTPLFDSYIEEIRKRDTDIVDAYFTLGKEIIEQNNYKMKRLRELMIIKNFNEKKNSDGFRKALLNNFEIGNKYTREFIKMELNRLFDIFDIKYPGTVTAKTIDEFFEIKEGLKIKSKQAIKIISPKI